MADNLSSAASGSSGGTAGGGTLRADEGLDKRERALETGLWGVLYTVSKEKGTIPLWFVIFRLFMDFWQLALLTVNPMYGFDINPQATWWRVVSFIQLNAFMSGRGYTFFLVALYIMVAGLVLAVGLSIWVMYSFQNNNFSAVWPIEVLRAFGTIFFQVLDVASMTFFLMAVDCQYFDIHPVENRYHNAEFPTVECWSMPHLIHVVVAIVSLVVFVIMAALFQMGDMELNLVTRNLLAMAHSEIEVVGFFIKVVMTCASVLINNNKWLAVIQLVCATILFFMYARWVPHYYNFTNHIRLATYAAVLWSAIMFAVVSFHFTVKWRDLDKRATFQHNVTIILWAGFAPCALLGALVSWLRLRYYQVTVLNRFKNATPESKPKELCVFKDARQVEIVARCCRVFIDVDDNLDPAAVKLAEQVIKCGLTQLPKDPFMVIFYSSFLIDVQQSYRSGYTQLQTAKKFDPSFLERFAIFTREQQHTQKSSGGHSGSMDLVAYVEFQRNYSLVLKAHREALLAMRFFWMQLQAHRVRFESLSRAVQFMDKAVRATEQAYRLVLERHSTNVKMLRLYAKFLEHVKHDPWNAAKWFAEADKAEVAEEEARENGILQSLQLEPELRDAFLTTRGVGGGSATVDRTPGAGGVGVILINAFGVVQMTNDGFNSLLGYNNKELHGKPVNLIIPPPFSQQHDGYLRTHIATGRSVIQGRVNQMLALHKDGRFVPVSLKVVKVSGHGEDAMFLGMMEETPVPPETGTLWVLPSGSVMSADAVYTDVCGFKATAVAGMSIASLARDTAEVLGLLKAAREAAQDARACTNEDGNGVATTKAAAMKGPSLNFDNDEETLMQRSNPGNAPLKSDVAGKLGEKTLSGNSDTSRSLTQRSSRFDTLKIMTTKDGAGNAMSWTIQSVRMNHKYSAEPVYVSMTITNGGIGLHMFHVVNMVRITPPALVQAQDSGAVALSNGALSVASAFLRKLASADNAPPPPPPPPNLQLVVDTKGRVAHVTSALAARLGSTPEHIMANGASNAFQALLMEPLSQLHAKHVSAAPPNASPPFSCRSGLSVLLSHRRAPGEDMEGAAGDAGSTAYVPFRMSLAKRVIDEQLHHVADFKEVLPTQALGERRMLLRIDQHGNILRVGRYTPKSLFGIKPSNLVGCNIMSILDVLKPGGSDEPSPMTALAEMALKAMETPGISWRVGVQSPEGSPTRAAHTSTLSGRMKPRNAHPSVIRMFVKDQSAEYEDEAQLHRYAKMPRQYGFEAEDEEDLEQLEDMEEMGADQRSQHGGQSTAIVQDGLQTRPSGPGVDDDLGTGGGADAHLSIPEPGAGVLDAGRVETPEADVVIDVELWRADLLMGFVQVDAHGVVTSGSTTWDNMLYDAGLVLGVDPAGLEGLRIGEMLPIMEGKPLAELFNPQLSQAAGAAKNRAGALKVAGSGASRVGPAHILGAQHFGDEGPLHLVAQAVRRANGCSLVIRPHQPMCGRSGFKAFISGAEPAVAPTTDKVAATPEAPVSTLPIGSRSIMAHLAASRHIPQAPSTRRSSVRSRVLSPRTMATADAWTEAEGADRALSEPGSARPSDAGFDSPRRTAKLAAAAQLGSDDEGTPIPGAVGTSKHASIKAWLESDGRVYPFTEESQSIAPPSGKRDSPETGGKVARPVSIAKAGRNSDDGSDQHELILSKKEGGSSGSDSADDRRGGDNNDAASVAGASELDDAENAENMVDDQAYKRGRRYKKMTRLLTSPLMQAIHRHFYQHTLGLVTLALAVHIGLFVLISILLKKQAKNVLLLNYIGRGASDAANMAISIRMIQALMLGWVLPGGLTGPIGVSRMSGFMKTYTYSFMDLHNGAFLGYNGSSFRMPNKYGLRELWETPSLPAMTHYRVYVNEAAGNNSLFGLVNATTNGSLFRIGCEYYANGLDVVQSIPTFVASGGAPANWPEGKYMTNNFEFAIFPGYTKTMDAMVSYVIELSKDVNYMQILILAAEGIALCVLAIAYMIYLASKLANHRYNMYSVFMAVPQSVVRQLATRRMKLTEEDNEEDDPTDPTGMALKAQGASAAQGADDADDMGPTETGVKKPKMSGSTAHRSFAVRASVGMWSFLTSCILRRSATVDPLDKDKRTLVRSYKRTVLLVIMFVCWAIFVIVINAVGYVYLKDIHQPIATFNIVNTVSVLYTRLFFNILALVIQTGKPNAASRADIMDKLNALKLEYMVMVYGKEAAPEEMRDSPHYAQVKRGIAHSITEGADLLFRANDFCLLIDQSTCPNATSPNYQILTNGLNNLFIRFFDVEGGIGTLQGNDPTITGNELTFLFMVHTHLRDGLFRVNDIYQAYVTSVYTKVQLLHVVLLVLVLVTIAIFLFFVLRPLMRQTANEPRRIAELLSQLPPDLDVEAVVQRKVLGVMARPPALLAPGPHKG